MNEKIAESVVAGLKGNPALLALVVLNVVAIGVAYWFIHELLEASHARMNATLTACLPGYISPK